VLHENNVEVDRGEDWNFPSLLRIEYEARFVAHLFVNAFSLQLNDKSSNGAGVRIDSDQCNSDGMD